MQPSAGSGLEISGVFRGYRVIYGVPSGRATHSRCGRWATAGAGAAAGAGAVVQLARREACFQTLPNGAGPAGTPKPSACPQNPEHAAAPAKVCHWAWGRPGPASQRTAGTAGGASPQACGRQLQLRSTHQAPRRPMPAPVHGPAAAPLPLPCTQSLTTAHVPGARGVVKQCHACLLDCLPPARQRAARRLRPAAACKSRPGASAAARPAPGQGQHREYQESDYYHTPSRWPKEKVVSMF